MLQGTCPFQDETINCPDAGWHLPKGNMFLFLILQNCVIWALHSTNI